MNRSEHQELIEQALAGKLTVEEKRRFEGLLASERGFKAAWQEELALDAALKRLPHAPVSSNFTSLVLQAVRAEERAAVRRPVFGWRIWSFRQAVATAAVFVGLGVLTVQYQRHSTRQEMAEHLSALSEVASILPNATSAEAVSSRVDLLQNFEAIQTLAYIPSQNGADMELLSALEK